MTEIPTPPYILVLNIEKKGELLFRKPITLKDGKCPAFNSVDEAVESAEAFIERIKSGNENIPAKDFDLLEIYIAQGFSDEKGKIDYGTTFAIVNSEFGRLKDYP